MTRQFETSEILTYATVRIECELHDGGRSTGTGYFFHFLREEKQHVPAIVTNRHVDAGAARGRFFITEAGHSGEPLSSHVEITLENFEQLWVGHPQPDVDLTVLPIAFLHRSMKEHLRRFFYSPLGKNLLPTDEDIENLRALEDILMVGYPNGIWDRTNNQPILRRGVTATHPARDYEGRPEFMIDAPCFPGSSGSPVFLYSQGNVFERGKGLVAGRWKLRLLGTLYAGPQYSATGEIVIMKVPASPRPVAVSSHPINLGLVLKSSLLLDFEPVLKAINASLPAA